MTGDSGRKGTRKKRGNQSLPLSRSHRNSIALLGRFRFEPVIGQRQSRLVAVAGILVQYALGDRAVNRRHCRMQQIAYGRGIACGDRRTHALHKAADARAVCAIHLSALARLRGTLQN